MSLAKQGARLQICTLHSHHPGLSTSVHRSRALTTFLRSITAEARSDVTRPNSLCNLSVEAFVTRLHTLCLLMVTPLLLILFTMIETC